MTPLFWRKPKAKNPWGDDDPLLSGWVPGLSERLDLFALIVSCMRSQWQLSQLMVWLARWFTFLSFVWALLAVLNFGYMMRWWWQ